MLLSHRHCLLVATFASLLTVFTAFADDKATELKVGVLAPLSGVRSDAGVFIKNAVQLAAQRLANEVGDKLRLQLVFEDTRYSAKDAVTGYKSLRVAHNVDFIIGPYGSSEVLAVAPLSERDGVILMIPGAQSEEITDAGRLIFRSIHNSADEAPFFARAVAARMTGRELPVMSIMTAFTTPYLRRFKNELEAHGKTVILAGEFEATESDFRTSLARLKLLKPADIMMLATPQNAAHILRQAAELGVTARWYNIGVEGPELDALADSLGRGLVYPYSFDCGTTGDKTRTFCFDYQSRFGLKPDAVAANSYDSLFLLAQCRLKSGESSVSIADCLYQTKDYDGVSGTFSFNKQGDAVRKLVIKELGSAGYSPPVSH